MRAGVRAMVCLRERGSGGRQGSSLEMIDESARRKLEWIRAEGINIDRKRVTVDTHAVDMNAFTAAVAGIH